MITLIELGLTPLVPYQLLGKRVAMVTVKEEMLGFSCRLIEVGGPTVFGQHESCQQTIATPTELADILLDGGDGGISLLPELSYLLRSLISLIIKDVCSLQQVVGWLSWDIPSSRQRVDGIHLRRCYR